jgi:UDP-GlcNAc:undecaprenyl-phosphate/decaprenyl-phosphate GlcNAc-1-phosphate transferase
MLSFIALALAFIVCVSGTYLLHQAKVGKYMLDLPSSRSLHSVPTPRIGGTAIAVSLVVNTFFAFAYWDDFPVSLLASICAYLVLVAISLLDDIRTLSVRTRLPLHLMVASIWLVVAANSYPRLELVSTWSAILLGVIATLGIGWAMNLYNFMDGSDGLAGAMAVTGFSAYAIAAVQAQDNALSYLCFSIIGASLGFLYFNWPKAKIFLGDSGSIPLGFLAAAVGVYGVLRDYWSAEFPMLVFAMFWVDATYTLVKRAMQGKKVWLSHREHWYQKAILSGNSHLKILVIHIVCNVCAAAIALIQVLQPNSLNLASRAITIIFVICMVAVYACWCESVFSTASKK